MTSTTTTLIMAIALPLLGFSQTENSSESFNQELPAQNIETTISTSEETIQVELVSSNAVSNAITVHTYKFLGIEITNMESPDTEPRISKSAQVQNIIDSFLSIEGVTRCTFDQATQTFTILSGPQTDLSVIVNQINKK